MGREKQKANQSGQKDPLDSTGQLLTRNPRSPAQPPNLPQALSKEALEAHTQLTEWAYANRDHCDDKNYPSQPFSQNSDEAQDLGGSYVDPQEAFNHKWGYLPPFDEQSEQVIAFIIENPTLAKAMARIQPGTSKFEAGLEERNVALKPNDTLDQYEAKIESLDVKQFMNETANEEECHELLWKFDQAKITATSSEALFQRTIMVSLIARHFLIYQRDSHQSQLFDFSVENLGLACQCRPGL